MKTSSFYTHKNSNSVSRYIKKALITLNKDLKRKSNMDDMRCKMTEEGETIANDFLEYDFSLSLQCCGYYIYWY